MPYSEQHKSEKARKAKRNRSKDNLCPCTNCKLEYTQSSKIVKRHLQVFGRYDGGHDEFSESGSEDELLANDLENYQEGSGNDVIPELSDCSEEHGEKERKRPRIDSTSSSESSDSEIFPPACEDGSIDPIEHQLEREGSEIFESTHCDLSTSSDDSQGEESVASNSDNDLELEVEHDIYDSENAKITLFENSDVTVLQALASYFMWFTEHPSTSKTALSDLLRLKKRLLPQPNNFPGSYDEAYSFVKPFLLPIETYHVCPNDCIIFRKTSRYDYSKLQKCPECGSSRYWANKSARRRFLYFPLGPRWKRMYGNANISEVLQSHMHAHDCETEEPTNIMRDIHDSPSWNQAFSEEGFSNGDSRGMLLQLSTDGVNPFSSNKVNYSMWPIMLTVLNLPRNVRNLFENILLAGIIPAHTDGQEPKNVDPYLEIVVDEILELSGATFFDGLREAPFTFKVALMNYVPDYPGLGKVFTTSAQAALQGCMWCELRGKVHCG